MLHCVVLEVKLLEYLTFETFFTTKQNVSSYSSNIWCLIFLFWVLVYFGLYNSKHIVQEFHLYNLKQDHVLNFDLSLNFLQYIDLFMYFLFLSYIQAHLDHVRSNRTTMTISARQEKAGRQERASKAVRDKSRPSRVPEPQHVPKPQHQAIETQKEEAAQQQEVEMKDAPTPAKDSYPGGPQDISLLCLYVHHEARRIWEGNIRR